MKNLNWKWGETIPVSVPVREESNAEIGDLLYYDDDGYAIPASDFNGTKAEFAKKFIGVAMQESRPGFKMPIRVSTTGTFEFTCEDKPDRLGIYMTVKEDMGKFRSWQITTTENKEESIGRIEHLENVPIAKAYIRINSFLRRQ